MTKQIPYQSWLNNPERRVGRSQLLRTMAAAVGTDNPTYREYKKRLAALTARPPARSEEL
jgi:hypothetical protein